MSDFATKPSVTCQLRAAEAEQVAAKGKVLKQGSHKLAVRSEMGVSDSTNALVEQRLSRLASRIAKLSVRSTDRERLTLGTDNQKFTQTVGDQSQL